MENQENKSGQQKGKNDPWNDDSTHQKEILQLNHLNFNNYQDDSPRGGTKCRSRNHLQQSSSKQQGSREKRDRSRNPRDSLQNLSTNRWQQHESEESFQIASTRQKDTYLKKFDRSLRPENEKRLQKADIFPVEPNLEQQIYLEKLLKRLSDLKNKKNKDQQDYKKNKEIREQIEYILYWNWLGIHLKVTKQCTRDQCRFFIERIKTIINKTDLLRKKVNQYSQYNLNDLRSILRTLEENKYKLDQFQVLQKVQSSTEISQNLKDYYVCFIPRLKQIRDIKMGQDDTIHYWDEKSIRSKERADKIREQLKQRKQRSNQEAQSELLKIQSNQQHINDAIYLELPW